MATPWTPAPMEPSSIKPSPVVPVPDGETLTKDQWRTLMAIADTVVPTIVEKSKGKFSFKALALSKKEYANAVAAVEEHALQAKQSKDLAAAYLKERPSQLPEFKVAIHRFLALNTPKDLFKLMQMGLNLLHYRVTSFVMTGHPSAFADQPVEVREAILQAWARSYIPIYRQLHKQLTSLVKQNWIKVTPTLYTLLKFPRVPLHGKPSPGFLYDFLQIPPGDDTEVIETDVVVVGSGCGGAVIAKNLAEAGHRVLVVDKAYHWTPDHYPMNEDEGWSNLFLGGGALFSDDSSTAIVAGSTWGGGGTVNWSASLQPQGFVRHEWATKDKLPFFASTEFQDCLDTVCNRMGVSASSILHNPANDVLLEGARRLGWAAKPVPQNTAGAQHYCGYCSFGCASCEKQGPVVTWLPDAAKAGATFLEGFDVSKITLTEQDGKKVATGVEGTWTSRDEHASLAGPPTTKRKVQIRAKRVVVSAGTLNSPLLLQRSGLKNKWIGRNLRLHPVTFVGAIYDHETRPWEGGILTAVVTELERLSKYHGCKIEAVSMMPSGWLSFLPWTSGKEYKLLAPRMKNMVGHFALQRDTGSGYVYADPADGRPRVVFSPSKTDRRHLLEGVVATARLNYVMGARDIFTAVPEGPTYRRSEDAASPSLEDFADGNTDPAFTAFLDAIRRRGLPDPDTTFVSAHQMGTCKMSSSPSRGVVDAKGKVWEVDEGLYVADASVFPSASGVNPMVTNMGIAEWISRNLVKDLNTAESRGMRAKM